MKPSGTLPVLMFILNLCQAAVVINASTNSGRKPYIVYMGELPDRDTATGLTAVDVHKRLLLETIGEERLAKESIIHSYKRSFNGFVARLLPEEATKLSEQESVVSVFPNSVRKLHTTRSWDFLGMPVTVTRNKKTESNLIIGVLDTGIWTMSPSFNDEGYGPHPSKWKGQCAKGANFSGCNNKVIGATYYNLDRDPQIDLTPVDEDGHGTHTSSTASGVLVPGASLYGLAAGTARGGASLTRLAMYKVCWSIGCTDMDVLAGFDAAIADGVDVISVSIGGTPRPFFEDPIAIGSFHAMKKGVFVSCSGGNFGPQLMTIENVAPWIMTVAASGIDQQFKTAVKLGNGVGISGISINTFSPKKQMYPLISGAQAANISGQGQGNASACDWGTMSPSKVKGKIVYCLEGSAQDSTVKDLGGSGVIMSVDEESDVAFFYVIPATTTTTRDGTRINHYINSTRKARAVVYKSRTVHINAPFVASFSSRGPQAITPNILKPDIAAPGLSILAAYSELASITGVYGDNRFSKYNIMSGTSMACPHVAAAAAYVKSFHPEWSPAAIKSALMTTATSMKIKKPDAELGSGSGQINPTKALDPGLVYEINKSSYISFLCKHGYTTTTIRLLTGGKNLCNCSTFPTAKGTDGLNYPSMHFQLQKTNSTISAAFYRTVTNVGYKNSVYRARVNSPEGLEVTVVPKVLSFNRLREKRSFKVLLKGKFLKERDWISSALLEWSDSYKHIVRSPILVYRSIFSTVY